MKLERKSALSPTYKSSVSNRIESTLQEVWSQKEQAREGRPKQLSLQTGDMHLYVTNATKEGEKECRIKYVASEWVASI